MHPLCRYENNHQLPIHIDTVDAICCVLCNEWLEEDYDDAQDAFCEKRPSIPLSVSKHEIALAFVIDYAKQGMIPPESKEVDAWDNLLENLYDLVNGELNR